MYSDYIWFILASFFCGGFSSGKILVSRFQRSFVPYKVIVRICSQWMVTSEGETAQWILRERREEGSGEVVCDRERRREVMDCCRVERLCERNLMSLRALDTTWKEGIVLVA